MFTIASYVFLVILGVVAVVHVISCIKVKRRARDITKPFLVPLVVLFYLASTVTPMWFLIVALLFGLGGDIFLIFQTNNQKAFLLGAACFLVGHVFYILLFASTTSWFAKASPWSLLAVVPYALFGFAMYRFLKNSLGPMKVPIIAYMVVILTASFVALTRWPSSSPASFWLVLSGTWLFITSDSLITLEYFKHRAVWNSGLVMITYILAQFFFAVGFLA